MADLSDCLDISVGVLIGCAGLPGAGVGFNKAFGGGVFIAWAGGVCTGFAGMATFGSVTGLVTGCSIDFLGIRGAGNDFSGATGTVLGFAGAICAAAGLTATTGALAGLTGTMAALAGFAGGRAAGFTGATMDAGVITGFAATAWFALVVICAGSVTSEGLFSEVIISESFVAHTPAYDHAINIEHKKAGNNFFIII